MGGWEGCQSRRQVTGRPALRTMAGWASGGHSASKPTTTGSGYAPFTLA